MNAPVCEMMLFHTWVHNFNAFPSFLWRFNMFQAIKKKYLSKGYHFSPKLGECPPNTKVLWKSYNLFHSSKKVFHIQVLWGSKKKNKNTVCYRLRAKEGMDRNTTLHSQEDLQIKLHGVDQLLIFILLLAVTFYSQ